MFELIGKEEYSIVKYLVKHACGDEWYFSIDSNETILYVTVNGEQVDEWNEEVVATIKAMLEQI